VTFAGRILTVFTLVLAIFFAAMTVVVFATHRNWKAESERLLAENARLLNLNNTYTTQIGAYKERLTRERAARRIVVAALETDRNVAQEQFQTANAQNIQMQQQVASMAAKNDADTKLLDTYVTENNGLKGTLTQEQNSRDTMFNTYVSIVDQLHELQGTLNDLTLRNTSLAEMYARYKDIIERLGPAATTAQELPMPVDGIVVAVSRELIEVSVGSDDGLKVGHTLDVFRKGGTYLGRVIVKKTSPDRSVAEIIPEFSKGPIRIEDRVATRFVD